jgi:hypothetical protein
MPDSRLTLANFMKTQLFTALGALKIGMDILLGGEAVEVAGITGHGGFFKAGDVGRRFLSAALAVPVKVMNRPVKAGRGDGDPGGLYGKQAARRVSGGVSEEQSV